MYVDVILPLFCLKAFTVVNVYISSLSLYISFHLTIVSIEVLHTTQYIIRANEPVGLDAALFFFMPQWPSG